MDSKAAISLIQSRNIHTIIAMKGKATKTLEVVAVSSVDTILELIMGPTGNLRAPTAIVGNTMYVGFNPEGYSQLVS